jgi:CheY-like chemotaxis protein
VVEDNAADCALIVEALTSAGYSVEVAPTGAAALAKFRERPFAALTLDLLLPDMTGVDLLAQIRAERHNADVPVVVLTVVAEEGAVAGFAVTDILAKPIDTAALLSALTRAGVSADRRGAILVVDDDPGSLRLMEATLGRCGYQTICRDDAEAALQAAAETRPMAVILDLVMPRMDGFAFLDRFRQMEDGRHTPVIIWTVKDLSTREQERLRETAHAIVFKGKDGTDALVRELQAFLSQPHASV